MTDLSCTDYSDKAIVVRGETKDHKEELKKLGGKYNANLREGPGWIFSKKSEDKVLAYIASGNLDDDDDEKKKPVSVSKKTSLLSAVEDAVKKMDIKERQTFLTNVIRVVFTQPVKAVAEVDRVKVTVTTKGSSSDEESPKPKKVVVKSAAAKSAAAKPVLAKSAALDSDMEDSDEDAPPPKRLLRPQ